MSTLNGFGEALASLRRSRGWTATQLGRALATSSTTINEMEAGVRLPRPRVLQQIAEALDADLTALSAALDVTKQERQRAREEQARAAPPNLPKPQEPSLWLSWVVAEHRRLRAMSLSAVDRACGFGHGCTRSIERGEVLPHDEALTELARVLNISRELLLEVRDQSRAARAAQRKPRREVIHG